jgi:hypothetical protein
MAGGEGKEAQSKKEKGNKNRSLLRGCHDVKVFSAVHLQRPVNMWQRVSLRKAISHNMRFRNG